MSLWNLIWILPLAFLAPILFSSLVWRLLNWAGRRHEDTVDRVADRLWPGITGKKDRHSEPVIHIEDSEPDPGELAAFLRRPRRRSGD